MIYINAFICTGIICLIGQIILDSFDIYDKLVLWAGGGAIVPITSFGHQLIHGAMDTVNNFGVMGLFMGMFDLTSSGIVAANIFSFFFSLIFQPKD